MLHPKRRMVASLRRLGFLALPLGLLTGCKLTVMNPAGDVAAQQADLIVYATVLMLIVILPVLALTVFFAMKYRASNEDETYEPEWDHSVSLEIVIWSVPLAIIIMLAGLTWVATHRLDPYQDLTRISATKPIDENVTPLEVQVVAMDWKWLFIYPEQEIATVNELAIPVDTPIEFLITSDTVMNSFFVPQLGSMIYAMAGMENQLYLKADEEGTFRGLSANYSGFGFSGMKFDTKSLNEQDFNAWMNEVKSSPNTLTKEAYETLSIKTKDHPIEKYSSVNPLMFNRIIERYTGVQNGQ